MENLIGSLGLVAAASYIIAIVAGCIGWINNIFALIHSVGAPLDGMFVLRIVGIFAAPLGAILGLFF